mgnify:CR=1 FL=1
MDTFRNRFDLDFARHGWEGESSQLESLAINPASAFHNLAIEVLHIACELRLVVAPEITTRVTITCKSCGEDFDLDIDGPYLSEIELEKHYCGKTRFCCP